VNDEFVLAHVVGWFAKTLLLRDAYLCLFLSIMFEIWEMTFQHQLPNFAECWWDHVRTHRSPICDHLIEAKRCADTHLARFFVERNQVILDILICNNIGIIVGMLTCRYLFKMKVRLTRMCLGVSVRICTVRGCSGPFLNLLYGARSAGVQLDRLVGNKAGQDRALVCAHLV
jgi:hypothetical protein